MYIKGVTPKPSRVLAEQDTGGQQWLAVVLLKLGKPPMVKIVPPPADPYAYTTWLSRGKNPSKRDLTGITYKRFIKDALLGKGTIERGTLQLPRRPLNLLHDRDSAHTSKVFTSFVATYNVNAVLLPARSPDLDPLDYGVFGPAQKKLDAEMEKRRMTFDEQCSFLEQTIKETNTDAVIMALPGRIARCIKAKGGHFE